MKEIAGRKNFKEWLVLPGMRTTFLRFMSAVEKYFDPKNEADSFVKPIILIGDTGTGKSLFIEAARQTFENFNPTKMNLYSRINCATLSKELVESEIFGHIKGAYTNAYKDKPGIVESIDTGLLVLDEIGETTEEVQAKLLVFVEDGEYRRVGENKTRNSRVKIIGTTNKPQKYFRPDFWYRFYPVFIPPLYERRRDVLYYLAIKYPEVMARLTPAHITSLLSYNWPGNIREIDRVISIMKFEDNEASIGEDNVFARMLPLKFPKDSRQTNLATIYTPKFGDNLQAKGFDVDKLNKEISEYGLKIQKSHYREISNKNYAKIAKTAPFEAVFLWKSNPEQKHDASKMTTCSRFAHSVSDKIINFVENFDTSYWRDVCLKLNIKKDSTRLMNIEIIKCDKYIQRTFFAFKALCKLFFKDTSSSGDILSIHGNPHLVEDNESNLEKEILLKFHNLGLPESVANVLYKDYAVDITTKYILPWSSYAKNLFHGVHEDKEQCELDELFSTCTERQLLSKYYLYLISNNRTLRLVAPLAGLKYETLRSKLRKLQINHTEIE